MPNKYFKAKELLASMRFAISLLTLICISAVIGTIIKQGEPSANYVNQFGPFWASLFDSIELFSIYGSLWFTSILIFLVTSICLCITRNGPKILKDFKNLKENIKKQNLNAFSNRAQGQSDLNIDQYKAYCVDLFKQKGWQVKTDFRESGESGVMIAARKGRINKIGYFAAHSAVVLICFGGLLDGDAVVHALMWVKNISAFKGEGAVKNVPQQHRLPSNNPTFRGNLFVSEGQRSGVALLKQKEGVVLQELPFDIELKKFNIEFYSTGMPKLFASEIAIHDHETGKIRQAVVKVNEPVFEKGIAIYQSSFEDGGSKLKIKAEPLGISKPFEVESEVGGTQNFITKNDSKTGPSERKISLELTDLRVFNIENLENDSSETQKSNKGLGLNIESHLGAGINPSKKINLKNIGPSISYKLRDESGQAREYNNYMLPVELDGQRVFLAGVKNMPNESFQYLRIPADENASMQTWLTAYSILLSDQGRDQAADRYVKFVLPEGKEDMAAPLKTSAKLVLNIFAGLEKLKQNGNGPELAGGWPAVLEYIQQKIPENDQAAASELLIRILNGCLMQIVDLARESSGLSALPNDDPSQKLMVSMAMSLSDAAFYPAPYLFELKDFEQIQASVFQLSRSPGKTWVYWGCGFLIIGVFAMLYIRDRRLWIWIQPKTEGHGVEYAMALSSNRNTLGADREFEEIKQRLVSTTANANATVNADDSAASAKKEITS